jgi:hypothetical protein
MKQAAKYFVAAVFSDGSRQHSCADLLLIDFRLANGYVDGELEDNRAGSDLYFWIKPNPDPSRFYVYENEALTVMGDGGGGK